MATLYLLGDRQASIDHTLRFSLPAGHDPIHLSCAKGTVEDMSESGKKLWLLKITGLLPIKRSYYTVESLSNEHNQTRWWPWQRWLLSGGRTIGTCWAGGSDEHKVQGPRFANRRVLLYD
jgi:hypothetical protein